MRLIILILFLSVIISCNKSLEKKKSKWNDSIVVYSQEEMIKIQRGMIRVIDTACINEEKRAYEDIHKGKIVYYFYTGMTEMYRSNKEMKNILSKYNIKLDSTTTSCIRPPKGFKTDCYLSVMDNEIEKRFGKKFIDSVRIQAEREYAIKHPNIVFEFEECDTVSRYPNTKNFDDFFNKPSLDFNKIFRYPKNYKYKVEKNPSKTVIEFVLTKDGIIKDMQTEVTFENPKNSQFEEYFRKSAEEFIKNVKWIPASKKGIKVNSKLHFWYLHK